MSTGNLKHQAAVAATADKVVGLRIDIHAQLTALVKVADLLEELADTRQSMGAGFISADMLEARAKADAATRQAIRIPTSRVAEQGPGLDWMRAMPGRASGASPAPVTMPAVSVLAEVIFTLRHHIRRLGRTGLLVALEAEQAEQEDAGVCAWPPRRITRIGIDPDATRTATVRSLAERLDALVDGYTNRVDLAAILTDLDNLRDKASDVIDGPAKTNDPEPCPWCGQNSLVIHHRSPGRDAAFIRCQGRHACECDWDWCNCHRNPVRNRHEWVNSGRATHTWTALKNLQNTRKELTRMETLALDALDRIRTLHAEQQLFPWAGDCTSPDEHRDSWEAPTVGDVLICPNCEPVGTVCAYCLALADDVDEAAYPCPTIQAIDAPTTAPDEA